MPNWNQLLDEIRASGSMYDVVRRRYLSRIHELTGRNVVVYCSGWLQKGNLPGMEINDDDKNGFMTVIHQWIVVSVSILSCTRPAVMRQLQNRSSTTCARCFTLT